MKPMDRGLTNRQVTRTMNIQTRKQQICTPERIMGVDIPQALSLTTPARVSRHRAPMTYVGQLPVSHLRDLKEVPLGRIYKVHQTKQTRLRKRRCNVYAAIGGLG